MAQFTLYCEYVHCCGKKELELGKVETEEQAEKWLKEQVSERKRPKLPKDDLIRTCPVIHCPAKIQFPIYNYRITDI